MVERASQTKGNAQPAHQSFSSCPAHQLNSAQGAPPVKLISSHSPDIKSLAHSCPSLSRPPGPASRFAGSPPEQAGTLKQLSLVLTLSHKDLEVSMSPGKPQRNRALTNSREGSSNAIFPAPPCYRLGGVLPQPRQTHMLQS